MFREYINSPIDPIPMEYVNTLHRINNEPDYSLTSYNYNYNNYTNYKYTETGDTFNSWMEKLKENGFTVKENVGAFIKAKTNVDCVLVYHKEKNCTACFVNSSDLKVYHGVLSFISLMFPSLFNEIPLRKPEDYDVILSLSKTDRSLFIQKIQAAVQPFVTEFRRIMLGNLLKSMHNANIEKAEIEIERQRSYIGDIEHNYANAIKLLKTLIVTYEGMKATEKYDQPEEDLVEYLSTNKDIHNLNISNGKLTFTVATFLNNFNINAWQTFSERGYIYDGAYKARTLLDVFSDRANRKILLDSIFSETPEFRIKLCGVYSIDLNNCYVQTYRSYDYNNADPLYKSYLPNPHLDIFACLGGYKNRVMQALKECNYIPAIELCCASAGSINLEETDQTFRPFLGWLFNSREKVLRRKDGTDMTPEEALIYLVDKEKANETA